jgi:hypothetical protein
MQHRKILHCTFLGVAIITLLCVAAARSGPIGASQTGVTRTTTLVGQDSLRV